MSVCIEVRRALLICPLVLGCGDPPEESRPDTAPAVEDAGVDTASAMPAGHDVLFIGNSYTFAHGIPDMYRSMVSSTVRDVRVEQVAAGGYRLEQHAADASDESSALYQALAGDAAVPFDALVLQEQSQIGGLPVSNTERKASIDAAIELAALARASGAAVVLYLTWGREHGDDSISSAFGFDSYLGMQDHLDERYLGLAALLREQGGEVRVAPVGGGFRLVYEDLLSLEEDPLAPDSDFDALYEPDGSHPSRRGSYLAACIIAATATRIEVGHYPDDPQLGSEISSQLRSVCSRAIEDPRWSVPTLRRVQRDLRAQRGLNSASATLFGGSLGVSSGGNSVLVGSPGLPGGAGNADLFVRDGDEWTLQASWQGPVGNGLSVAISGDGSRAFLSNPVRAFARDGDSWTELSSGVLDAPHYISINAAGTRAVASTASGEETGPDVVVARVYQWQEDETWVEEALLRGRPRAGFSAEVAIDGEGSRIVVTGQPNRVYRLLDGQWVEEARLPVDYGRVAISQEGTHVVVGLQRDDVVVLFERMGSSWSERARFRSPARGFGVSVAVSGEGERVFVGVATDGQEATRSFDGSVRVYRFQNGRYENESLIVPPSFNHPGQPPNFGAGLAVSADGGVIAIGAPGVRVDGAPVGAAYVLHL